MNWKKYIMINLMLSMFFITMITAMSNNSERTPCLENLTPCIQNTDCCNGYCFKEKCMSYVGNFKRETNPCFHHECPPGKVCYLQNVQCIRAPCPPIPACKPIDYN